MIWLYIYTIKQYWKKKEGKYGRSKKLEKDSNGLTKIHIYYEGTSLFIDPKEALQRAIDVMNFTGEARLKKIKEESRENNKQKTN